MARKKKRPVEEPDDDDDFDGDDSPVRSSRPGKTAPPDAYVGLLAITFVALATAAGLLYFDFESLSAQITPAPSVTVPDLGAKAGG